MSQSHASLWTLDELSAQAALALAVDYSGQANGRVCEVPDIRTIRYYTALDLLDRPAHMRGRTALYGERHLLQLVAIKRLQAKGLSLAEVQARVTGQSDAVLRRLAQLPAHHAEAERTRTEETTDERRSTLAGKPTLEVRRRIEILLATSRRKRCMLCEPLWCWNAAVRRKRGNFSTS